MNVGDRVQLAETDKQWLTLTRGTIEKMTPANIIVHWDHEATRGYFSLHEAERRLVLATGEDALPRHRWISRKMGGDPTVAESQERTIVCNDCGIQQTDENEFGPCK